MNLEDGFLLDEIIKLVIPDVFVSDGQIPAKIPDDHVLNKKIMDELKRLQSLLSKGGADFYHLEGDIKKLWIKLVDMSIKCLRFYDPREPFMHIESKKPETYRIEDLKSYFDQFSDFEGLLYGSNKKYRDHVIHTFRIWLLGVYILLTKTSETNTRIIDKIVLDGIINSTDNNTKELFKPNKLELLSMWTLISLCHDLGYPLEKREEIIENTERMMTNFFPNASITMTYSNISGIHDDTIKNIVKFISSVIEVNQIEESSTEPKTKYSGRVQNKYCNKFSKSLENFSHGIISAIILFKSLDYFSESDFSIEGDYSYSIDDAKQFYIRREILRSIAMHTCSNVYHIKTTTLPFLLILCDELQEWNRKAFIDFYSGKENITHDVVLDLDKLNENDVRICESLKFGTEPEYYKIFSKYFYQYEKYRKIFRDGLDTSLREFSFNKEVIIIHKEEIIIVIDISKNENSNFSIRYEKPAARKIFNDFLKNKIADKYILDEREKLCLVSQKDY